MTATGPGSRNDKPRHWGALPVGLVVAIGVILAVGVPTAGYYTYRTYDYIQHDNDFCMSCHLMADPFEAFNRSEHRGLGCKACHQPTLVGRSQMALTQVLEQPEEILQHAEIGDDICAACHVDGDPEKWQLIANSAGHRVHLESAEEDLAEIECVTCHSMSVHEFASSDETCAEAGCHTESEIHLGRMGDYSIGCSSCHSFRAPVDEDSDFQLAVDALRPESGECLSCHVMRSMVDLPLDDPHAGICADCHNPHDQEVAEDASAGCAMAGCHEDPQSESQFHEGLAGVVIEDCASCHSAHDFKADGSDCQACHGDMADDRSLTDRPPAAGVVGAGGAGTALIHGPLGVGGRPTVPGPLFAQESDFRHSEHTDVSCLSCHSSEEGHGTVTVLTEFDCASCHHSEPEVQDCASCHEDSGSFRSAVHVLTRPLDLSTGWVPERDFEFDHAEHETEDCASCHEDRPGLSAAAIDCSGCHTEHHRPDVDCTSCHVQAPAAEHPVEQVHVTCSGAACHVNPPIEGVPETRPVCLTCHQDQVDHIPAKNCVTCHPVSGGGL